MKFCTKCGNEVTEEKLFCTYCGNDLRTKPTNKTEPIHNANLDTIQPGELHAPNLKLSKKSKIIMSSFIILVILIFAIIKVGNSLSDPNKVVTRFKQDVASNNVSDLSKILYCNDPRLKVDSKNIAPLISYYKSNPANFNKIIENLNDDAFKTNSINPKDVDSVSTEPSNVLTLIKAGKNFLIFPKYKISIKPSFINITTTVKDVTFSINNTQIGKSDTDSSTKQFGPYIPGNYSILANYKGKYVTLSKPYPVDLVSPTSGIAELSIFDDMKYLNITSDNPDAEIFVNGKDTKLKVQDATKFGPIDNSAKIYATYVKSGKKLKSDECSFSNGDTSLYLSFQNSTTGLDDVQNQLKDLLGYYTSYFTQAVNTNNTSLIDPYVASGTELYKQQKSYIPSTYKAGIQEEVISANITNYNISDDNKSGSITTSEVYNIIAKDSTSYNKTFNYVYEFQYNDSTSSYQFTNIN